MHLYWLRSEGLVSFQKVNLPSLRPRVRLQRSQSKKRPRCREAMRVWQGSHCIRERRRWAFEKVATPLKKMLKDPELAPRSKRRLAGPEASSSPSKPSAKPKPQTAAAKSSDSLPRKKAVTLRCHAATEEAPAVKENICESSGACMPRGGFQSCKEQPLTWMKE